jgi:hypothetical protein
VYGRVKGNQGSNFLLSFLVPEAEPKGTGNLLDRQVVLVDPRSTLSPPSGVRVTRDDRKVFPPILLGEDMGSVSFFPPLLLKGGGVP